MKKRIFITLFLFSLSANAELIRNPNEGVRPTGMGNAFIALADDANALMYNPAGLARISGAHSTVIDLLGGFDSWDTLNRVNNAIFKGDTQNLIRPDTQFMRFSSTANFITRYFGLSLFDNIQSFTDVGSVNLPFIGPVPNVDIYAFNDIGVIAGFGIPIGDYFSFGFSVKALERNGLDQTLSPQQLLAILGVPAGNFNQAIFNYLQTQMGLGWGIGCNIGTLIKIPLQNRYSTLQLAGTIDDFGDTTFFPIGPTQAPPKIRHSVNLGAALLLETSKKSRINFDLDFRNMFDDVPLIKQVHLGMEYRHKLFGLRLGAYQGYPTFGLSMEALPHTRIHLSTYAVELGSTLWERNQRWWLFQISIGFNPI